MKKVPYFAFYTGDWKKNVSIGSVSASARGVFVELLCTMHEGERRGYLQLNNKPIELPLLARLARVEMKELVKALKELAHRKVLLKTKDGIFYDPYMVADQKMRVQQARYGKQGGNPSLVSKRNGKSAASKSAGKREAMWEGKIHPIWRLEKVLQEMDDKIAAKLAKPPAKGDSSHNIWLSELRADKARRQKLFEVLYGPTKKEQPQPVQEELKPQPQEKPKPQFRIAEIDRDLTEILKPDESVRNYYYAGDHLIPKWKKRVTALKKERARLEKEVGV